MTASAPSQAGFTLIEALIALAILGIATAGILRAVEAHVDRIGALEQRTAAQWVAENALAEAALGGRGAPAGEVPMLGWRWSANVQLAASDDPDLSLATVQVRRAGTSAPLVVLRGFVDRGTVTR